MRVLMLRDFRCWQRGETVEVSPVVGLAWIEAGVAQLVDGGPETAMLAPERTAMLPGGRARRKGD